ncbi:patatin-like phospholipase family protein [Xanthomarina sp. F1114]|uniref:patatin-like phospholipase family protein n=1 Tax=Xanthomarina sp. F1114 TaxID=2996019 RepID=UPI00225E17DE|nr:patatin-like phospholipase family protein [Xanthomarina sp. F1114]MCX7548126.1 patatin-like phospholipase family protein [Xanthomarina sp. F1114]
MFNHFNFSKEEKKIAKTYFDAADVILANAIKNDDLSLKTKINKDDEIDIKWISDATIIEKTKDKAGNIIEKQRPIIDLVQQGGGMWGIALLGYCYILEKVGIRFYSHGGTSAGAINALFLASISADVYKEPPIIETDSNRGALKSEILTLIVSNMDFSSFMNRGGIVGKIQKTLFKNINSKGLPIFLGLASLIIIMGMYFSAGLLLNDYNMSVADVRYFSFIIGTCNIFAFFILIYILFAKVLGENFGLNTGNPFLFWVRENLAKLHVNSTQDLYACLSETKLIRNVDTDDLKGDLKTWIKSNTPKTANSSDETEEKPIVISEKVSQQLAVDSSKYYKVENPKIVLITSNLSHNRIVRFPKRANEYWENHLKVHPAAYVRASMSLPFIFNTFIPNSTTHYEAFDDPKNKVKLKARMVDGGMLSNFPIREFHRSSSKAPSFPTFGVLLSKRSEIKSEDILEGQRNSLLNYVGSYVKTFRNFYDNDFLIDNEEIRDRVVTVDTRRNPEKSDAQINWLDFWMTTEDKRLLFIRGAEAAIRQLDKFDWKTYKDLRIKLAKDAI